MSRATSIEPLRVRRRQAVAVLCFVALVGRSADAEAVPPVDILKDQEQALIQLFDAAVPSVVLISQGDSMGTGFFINDNGYVLTNQHGVGRAEVVDILLRDGGKHRAVVLATGKSLDVALLKTTLSSTPYLRLKDPGATRLGSFVASIGHGAGGVWTFTTGMVSNIYPIKGTKGVIQTQIPLNPGNSGGPLLDRHGQVLGIVTAGIVSANSVNFAIRVDDAVSQLEMLAELTGALIVRTPPSSRIFIDGQFVGEGPFYARLVEAGRYEVVVASSGSAPRSLVVVYPAQRIVDMRQPGASK